MHLISTQLGVHEVHFALVDHAGKVTRAWRVTSSTQMALAPSALDACNRGRRAGRPARRLSADGEPSPST
jgi:hypothetical protein